MDPENNGSAPMRLTIDQARKLVQAMNNTKAEAVDISRGADGRLIVKQVVTVERYKALKLT